MANSVKTGLGLGFGFGTFLFVCYVKVERVFGFVGLDHVTDVRDEVLSRFLSVFVLGITGPLNLVFDNKSLVFL